MLRAGNRFTAAKDTSVVSPSDEDLAGVAVLPHALKRLGRPGDRKHRVHDHPERSAGEVRQNLVLESAHDGRSEEHTSELQSLAYLVCRLLLEKKKKQTA